MRFYATVRNGRGNETGSSVNEAHVRGWHAGIRVSTGSTPDGRDKLFVYMTSGSTGATPAVLLGTVYDTPDGPVWEAAADRMSADAYTEGTTA
jgi:hypothetical protein